MFIFLDIDGVMVPAKNWLKPEFLTDGFPAFSPNATAALKSMINEDTTVLLTTSHKSKYSISEWRNIFERRGISLRRLEKLNDNLNSATRKEEIVNWFTVNKINEEFIIIDDDKSLNSLPAFLKDHFLLTSSLIGLTESGLKEFISHKDHNNSHLV